MHDASKNGMPESMSEDGQTTKDNKQHKELNIMNGEATTRKGRGDTPEQKMLKAEPVDDTSIDEMVKQMSATMDKGLKKYISDEKEVDSRIFGVEEARGMTLTPSASTATATELAVIARAVETVAAVTVTATVSAATSMATAVTAVATSATEISTYQ